MVKPTTPAPGRWAPVEDGAPRGGPASRLRLVLAVGGLVFLVVVGLLFVGAWHAVRLAPAWAVLAVLALVLAALARLAANLFVIWSMTGVLRMYFYSGRQG